MTTRVVAGAEWRTSEPAAAIEICQALVLAATRQARDEIALARAQGMTWDRIGELLQLGSAEAIDAAYCGYADRGEAAFEFASAARDHLGRTWCITWTCPQCARHVRDYGPMNGPAQDQRGHADDCSRWRADVAAWEAEEVWDSEEEVSDSEDIAEDNES